MYNLDQFTHKQIKKCKKLTDGGHQNTLEVMAKSHMPFGQVR